MSLLKIISLFTIIIVRFLSVTACAGEPSSNNIENFMLPDYNGAEHSLSDYKESKAIVIMFIATECPVSNDYNSRMEKLYNDYKQKGIAFIGINSNKAESVIELKSMPKKRA